MIGKKNQQGQVLPLFFVCIMVLCLFWFVLINLGKLVKDRMMMQNAADNAAVSAAIMRARALNYMGPINAYLGLPGFSLGSNIPSEISHVWVPCPNHGAPLSVCWCGSRGAKNTIEGFIKIQEGIHAPYGGGTTFMASRDIAKRQELDSEGKPAGADGILTDEGTFSLHLKRNKGEIWYWGTMWVNTYLFGPIGPTLLPPQICGCIVNKDKGKRWLEQTDDFHKQKVKIVAYKNRDSNSNKAYPFAGKLFGIEKWFDIRTVAAAASYNSKGAMFPTPGDSNTPMAAFTKYIEAMDGGWEAHLVPAGSECAH